MNKPENDIANAIWASCLEAHKAVGPQLLEKIYEDIVVYELRERGLEVEHQVKVLFYYKGVRLPRDYFMDLVVEGLVPIELKVVSVVLPVHRAQLLSYLRLTRFKLGILANFGARTMVDGFSRVANGL